MPNWIGHTNAMKGTQDVLELAQNAYEEHLGSFQVRKGTWFIVCLVFYVFKTFNTSVGLSP